MRRPLSLLALVPLLSLGVLAYSRAQDRAAWSPPSGVRWTPDVVYGKGGERELKLDVLEPEERPGHLMPALVYVHGGGWTGGDKRAGLGLNVPYAARGYFTVSVQYRFSQEATFPAQIEDVKAAVRWVRANAEAKGIDPKRIGVWGHSAGGHLAALLGTAGEGDGLEGSGGNADRSSRVSCVVDLFGPNDLVNISIDATDRWGKARLNLLTKLLGGPPEEKQELARRASPTSWATPDDPPVLIVHGTADPLVPFDQAERFRAALEKAGVPVTLLPVEGAGHGWRKRPEVDEKIAAFFARHLRQAMPSSN